MYILTLRTDRPEAEIGLYKDQQQLSYEPWMAHRQLAETIHLKIKATLDAQKLELQDLGGIVIYQGPGSFTGLRIGIAVANALADSVGAAIIGREHETWLRDGLARILVAETDIIVVPAYGALPNITAPRK